jgi:hypothetical protein
MHAQTPALFAKVAHAYKPILAFIRQTADLISACRLHFRILKHIQFSQKKSGLIYLRLYEGWNQKPGWNLS